jgi:hypothetical protein
MIKFSTDNGQSFEYPESLSDVTLKQYLEFLEFVESTKPKVLKDIDTANIKIAEAIELKDNKGLELARKELDDATETINDIVQYQQIFPYYARVVSFFSGLSVPLILGQVADTLGMRVDHLTGLYIHTTKIFNQLPEVEYSNVLEVNGEVWYLPERFMSDSTVIEFAEAAQFQANLSKVENGEWKALAKMMCVLVRKKDEQYSDKLLKREELFLSWNLLDCWRVAFFLLRRTEVLQLSFQTYTNVQTLMQLRQELINSTMDSVGT